MQNRMSRSLGMLFAVAGVIALVVACASSKGGKEGKQETSESVTLEQLTAPAQATVSKLIGSGTIDKVDREIEKGRTVYDVEATVNGQHMEYTITTDGTVVGTETGIEFSELPDAVQAAAEKYFGRKTALQPARVEEDGRVTYEVEGKKDGKNKAVTFDANGKRLQEED